MIEAEELLDEVGQSYGLMNSHAIATGQEKGWDSACDAIDSMAAEAFRRREDKRAHELRDLADSLRQHEQRRLISQEAASLWRDIKELRAEAARIQGEGGGE